MRNHLKRPANPGNASHMKTPLLILLTATCLAASVRAEVVVYRESERAHVTVAGREIDIAVTTYVAMDSFTRQSDAIGSFKIGPNKYYAVSNGTKVVVTQNIGGRLGTYTVFSKT